MKKIFFLLLLSNMLLPTQCASDSNHYPTAEEISFKGLQDTYRIILQDAYEGKLGALQRWVQSIDDLNITLANGLTLLHAACCHPYFHEGNLSGTPAQRLAIVRFILSHPGVNTYSRCNGQSALDLAQLHQKTKADREIVRLLKTYSSLRWPLTDEQIREMCERPIIFPGCVLS